MSELQWARDTDLPVRVVAEMRLEVFDSEKRGTVDTEANPTDGVVQVCAGKPTSILLRNGCYPPCLTGERSAPHAGATEAEASLRGSPR